jgi:hypothetical protein
MMVYPGEKKVKRRFLANMYKDFFLKIIWKIKEKVFKASS